MFKLIALFLSVSASFASTECLSVTDSLDREYCFKKSLRSEEMKLEKQLITLKKSLSMSQKAQVLSLLESDLEMNKEEADFLLKKQEIIKSHKEKVAGLSVTKVKTTKKKKKNKLKDSLKKLGIKL